MKPTPRLPGLQADDLLVPSPQGHSTVGSSTDGPSRIDMAPHSLAGPYQFCPACGSPWQAGAEACPSCAAHRDQAPVSAQHHVGLLRSGILLYFAILGVGLATAIGVYSVGEGGDETECHAIIADSIATSVLVLIWSFVGRARLGAMLLRVPSIRWFALAAIGAGLTFALVEIVVTLLFGAIGLEEVRYSAPFLSAGYGWTMIVLLICVQPALIEELAFRGLIFAGMEQVLGGREAVLVSSLMFMVIHLSVPSFPHLLVIGLAIGLLRWWTGSLYPGMLLHFLHNLLVVLSEPPGA
jgi:membrane protease YdiL (CAAX protease family)